MDNFFYVCMCLSNEMNLCNVSTNVSLSPLHTFDFSLNDLRLID